MAEIANSHIRIRGLSVNFGSLQALKNVTVDVPDKQITAIIGPSGCGKTTLLKCFNRMIDLNEEVNITGSVLVDGVDIYSDHSVDPIEIRKKMGLLFQRPFPLPMSIYDNVVYGPRLHSSYDRAKLNVIVEKQLKLVGLWDEVKDRLGSPASKLSAGQQQRLCLARGLAVEPEIVLADEPTSALDPISAQYIEKAFMELKKNYTVVLVTHILRQARRLADYIIFLYMGELVEYGPASEVLNNPREKRTQAYVKGEIS